MKHLKPKVGKVIAYPFCHVISEREGGRILVLRRRGGWTVGRNEMQGGRRELGRKVTRTRKTLRG